MGPIFMLAAYTFSCIAFNVSIRFLLYVNSSVKEMYLCNTDSPIDSFCTDGANSFTLAYLN